MSEMQAKQPSAVVFGARNLGRAVIELLVSDGWAVTGVARSQSTLDGVSAAGALALKADVTEPASVYGVLEQAATAHGEVDLVLNAAAAYGGERTGPFGGGPIAEADLDGFDSWAAAPARAAFSFLSASGRFAIAQGRAATLVQVTGGSARRALPDRGADPRIAGRPRSWPCSDPSSRLCGDAFCTGEMRRQELSGSVQRRDRFVEDRVIDLEDVGHPRGDVERDLDVGGDGLSREADGVVEENLVSSGLDDQGRQAGQVGEYGADEAKSGVLSRRVVGHSGLEALPAEQRVDFAPGFHGRPGQGEIGIR
jgi:NAD(P)-dependent dehydrogenase (short-subunit alcohol dehydrogenase family)